MIAKLRDYVIPMIKSKKYTRKQIQDKALKKFPDNAVTVKSQISRSLNPELRLNKWGRVAKVHPKSGIMYFTKRVPE